MTFSIEDIKQHAEAFITKERAAIGGEWHSVVNKFVSFIDGTSAATEAEKAALDLLKAAGYTVTAPDPADLAPAAKQPGQ